MFWYVQKKPLLQIGRSAFAGLSLYICMHRNAVVISLALTKLSRLLLNVGFALPSPYCRGNCAVLTQWYRAQRKHREKIYN